MKLKDKVAIITGGAMGIGEATARLFAAEGAAVVIGDVADEAAGDVVQSLTAAGSRATYYHVDVRRPADVERLINGTIETFGGIDILINNAGVALAKSTTGTTLEEWERVLGINLTGAWLCARAAIPAMIRRGGGTISLVGTG